MAVALLLAVASGCAPTPAKQGAASVLGITQMSTAIGGTSPTEQRISYTITLVNGSGSEVSVTTLRPVLSDQFARRLSSGDTVVRVGRALKPQENLTVSGEVSFDAGGVSKEEIASWGPAITGARIETELEVKAQWSK